MIIIEINDNNLSTKIDNIRNQVGIKDMIIVKNFLIGKGVPLEGAIIYNNGLADKNIIDRDILKPLMLNINETLSQREGLCNYISKRYITMSYTVLTNNINDAIEELKTGKTIFLIEGSSDEYIIIDTEKSQYRSITDSLNENTARGSRESFIENLDVNVSMIKRLIKDKKLTMEKFILGRRGQNDLIILYIDDIVDKDVLNELKKRITAIDVDKVPSIGALEQYIEDYAYSPFPQIFSTERVDRTCANIMEGKIAILLQGTSYVLTVPSLFVEFFHSIDDINERTIIASATRLIRFIAMFVIISASPVYLVYIRFNPELIPSEIIVPIILSRTGIALKPFMEILLMEFVIELLREGGLRLPGKIAQTLSVVGGIIVGDAAIRSKFVSPTTLFVIGISVIASFVITNYEMSLAIRFMRFPMLLLAQLLGLLGIAIGWFLIFFQLCYITSFGIPYISLTIQDEKDKYIRAPLWKMNKRPDEISGNDKTRQTDFRKRWWGK